MAPSPAVGRKVPDFPPRRSVVTYGEAVSDFNRSGNVASRRHSHMSFAQQNHCPNNCSIQERVACGSDHEKEHGKHAASRALPTARSRTPSPWAHSRRSRSTVTPRVSTPTSRRHREMLPSQPPHIGKACIDSPQLREPTGDQRRSFSEALRYHDDPCSFVEPYSYGASSSYVRGSHDDHYGSRGKLDGIARKLCSCQQGHGGGCDRCGFSGHNQHRSLSNALRESFSPESPAARRRQVREPHTSSEYCGVLQEPSSIVLRDVPQQQGHGQMLNTDPRAASIVRLNSFLLRTHITSLVSALAEDGWLETWEKERLCCRAREDSQQWARNFLQIYLRFTETDDVQAFVAGLRVGIA